MSIRGAIESLYSDLCDVYEMTEYKKSNGSTAYKSELVISQMPCRISYSSSPAAVQGESAAVKSQTIKLFYAPERVIKAGSRIKVTRQGITTEYKASGEAAIYSTHKETVLEVAEVKV